MAQAAPFLLAASVGMQAIGMIQQGQAQANAARYNAAIADRNAQIATDQANQDAQQQQRVARQRIGAIRAGYGASGVDVAGSPLDVLADSASQAELDRQTILYKGKLRALGYSDSATLDRYSAGVAETAGYMGAGSAILTGATKGADRGYFGSAGGGGYNIPSDGTGGGVQYQGYGYGDL